MNRQAQLYLNHDYSVLGHVSRAYKDLDMSDILLVSCQHLLGPQLTMFCNFFDAGLKPENCLTIGKNYSSNTEVLNELRYARCPVAPVSEQFNPCRRFDTWFSPRVTEWIADIISDRNMNKIRRIIVLDDGGYVHESLFEIYGNNTNYVAGVEQTSSGRTRIERLKIKFAQHMVATSLYKQQEARFIGVLGAERISAHIQHRGITSPQVLVFGMDTIGRNTAAQLYLKHGFEVDVTDINYSHTTFAHLRSEKINTMFEHRGLRKEYHEVMRSLPKYDVIVGATGAQVLNEQYIRHYTRPSTSFISMSSGDVEFDPSVFRSARHRMHDDCMLGEKCLVNTGFPITFYGNVHELHPLQIELTIAQLQASVMDLAQANRNNVSEARYETAIQDAYKCWNKELIQHGFITV